MLQLRNPTFIFIKAKNYVGLSTLHETREGCSKTPTGTVISQLNFWSVYFYSPHQALCVDLLMINSPILMEYFYSWGLAIPDLSQGGRK